MEKMGDTTVCRWKGDRVAAFSIGADDSIHSQLDFMIPEMQKRGFCSTFWINPGRGTPGELGFCWESRRDEWLAAARLGNDFGNHTVYHVGARYYGEAEYEIGESARIIWAANPGQRLQLFLSGGGTTWNVSREEIDEILARYFCVNGRGGGRGGQDPCYHGSTGKSATADELTGHVDTAISEGSWHFIGCHGVGPKGEWLTTDEEPFVALLDYLVEKEEQVWVGTHTQVHKYDVEQESARASILEATAEEIRLDLTAETDPLLYDYPLTLQTRVPSDWESCRVVQTRTAENYPVNAGMVEYEAVPGNGDISLTTTHIDKNIRT